jgi:hypothetical protein
MGGVSDLLFCTRDLSQVFRGNLERSQKEIDAIPERQILGTSEEEIVQHLYSKLEVIPIRLLEDQMESQLNEVKVDVRHDRMRAVFDSSRPCMIPGVRAVITVPFEGDPGLWNCQPSRYTLNPPRGSVRATHGSDGGNLVLTWELPTDTVGDGTAIRGQLENALQSIREYLATIRRDVEAHNAQLLGHIRSLVGQRRSRLEKHSEIAKTLNIPLKRSADAPDFEPLPMKRRLVKPLPGPTHRPPEYGIQDEEFEFILKVIRHEGRSFETTPRTYARHGEEELRDFILSHLNTHYEGRATGETFRNRGKTDIRVMEDDRSAFVAECKVWRGAGEVCSALDQLLGYLTWRDCKAALIFFNTKNAGFTSLRDKLFDAVAGHAHCEGSLKCDHAGEWRFRFRAAEDADHKIELHVFLFNVYVGQK